MKRIRWYGPTVLLVLTTLAVMFVGPRMAEQIAWAQTRARISLIKDELTQNPSLAELSEAFREVAEVVAPSVVHLRVSTKRAPRQRLRSFEEDLLRRWRFFGPDGPRGRRGPGPDDSEDPDDFDHDEDHEDDEDFDQYNVPKPYGNGSGWVYDRDGHIITNYHVVEDADVINVRFQDGSERKAKVIGADPKTDIAVIKVEGDSLHPATLASKPVEQGEIVFAFGSPFRFEFSMSQGIVSGKGRRLHILDSRQGYENFIQTDAAINPGNSGGPLTNIYGQVVGMNTAIATRTGENNGLGFAIPIKMVKSVVEQLIETGRVSRGYLGIFIRDLNPKLAKTFGFEGQGVLVENPIAEGPAEQAGVMRGDIITQINGDPVGSADQLRHLVASISPDTKLTVEIFRRGQIQEIEITIGELPDKMAMAKMRRGTDSDGGMDEDDRRVLRRLGLDSVATLTKRLATRLEIEHTPGVVVRSVRPESTAEAGGISRGNIITHVMGTEISSVGELVEALNQHDLTQGVRMSVIDRDMPRFVWLELPE